MNEKGKIFSVYQLLRLFSISMVVLAHSSYLVISTKMGGLNWILPENTSALYFSPFFQNWHFATAWGYRFLGAFFFMCSGSVYALSPAKDFKTLVSKKAKRLLIAYFLCGALFMIPIKTMGGFYEQSQLPKVYFRFLLGQETGHLWFLIALFWCFLLFYGLKKILKKDLLVLGASFLIYLYHKKLPIDLFEFSFCSQYIFFFTVGVFVEKLRPKIEGKKLLNLLIFALFLLINIKDTQNRFLPEALYMISGGFLFYALAFCLCAFFNLKFLDVVAKKSFEVYLYHDPLMVLILFFLMENQVLTTNAGTWFYLFSRTFGVVIFSLVVDYLIQRGVFLCRYGMKRKKNNGVPGEN